jgi:MFS family permease
MWAMAAEIANYPVAILIGYLFGRFARRRGDSAWTAYALAVIPGAALAAVSELWFGERILLWPNALVWLAWTGFGVSAGWREPKQKSPIRTLNLSARQ